MIGGDAVSANCRNFHLIASEIGWLNDCWFLISCSRPNIVNNELLKPHVVPLSTISGLILYLAGGLETSSTDLKFPLKVLVNPLNP